MPNPLTRYPELVEGPPFRQTPNMFWTDMLHCRGGYFYTGHAEDFDRRIAEHRSGLMPGFSADHQPMELIWSESFQTRDDAKGMENRIKGWSRAKMALIRGDFEAISRLAKTKGPDVLSLSKDCPSSAPVQDGEQTFDKLRAAD